MIRYLLTTEDMIWIQLPFRIRKKDQNLTWLEARRRSIRYRKQGRLARTVKFDGMWATATYKPRVYRPRQCDLVI